MANSYGITVALDSYTLGKLQAGNYSLQVFKGAKGNQSTALPTLWFSVTEFSATVSLKWTEQYGAFVDNQTIANGVVVDISSSKAMNLGDLMTLLSDGDTNVTTTGGRDGAITVFSQQSNEWICGMTQSMNGSAPTPICAFPLFGSQADLMEPYETVVLMFASGQVATGTVVEEAISSSVTITLSGAAPSVAVAFDMNLGWNTSGNPYAVVNPLPINLAETLIVPIS
ncbi:hypothetical protein [Mucilaginibacter ginsenosidivorans]|uniref:Uncharacterized protein n=1 Tax=Mucilaginibacter ginsenosidivorans TaxID=398053 RepID=A0A5B8V0S5_9SPHI|nr:hypothetical protein [Mucilaginibacter ginsenosidivorans]QEC64808.1 hypothetical protein FRZ54_20305 [Mucilaginibacter ginsenosidivorans]